jgi:MFS family permease
MFRENKEVPEDSGLTPDFNSMIKIVFWNSMGFFFFNFLIPFFIGIVMETSMLELGVTFSMLIIGGLFSSPLVGYLTDKTSKKRLVFLGSIGRGISYIILYTSCILLSVDGFKFGMLFLGLSVGFFWTPFDSLISEKSKAENRSYAFGKRSAAMGRGNFVGSIISFTIFATANTFVPDLRFLVYSPLIIFAAANFYAGTIFYKNVNETLKYETSLSKEHIHHLDSDAEMYLEGKTQMEIERKNGFLRNSVSIGLIIGFLFLILARFFSMVNGTIADPFMQNYIVENIVDDSILVMLIYFPSGIISQIIAPKLGILSDKINNSLGIAMASITGALFTLLLINTTMI